MKVITQRPAEQDVWAGAPTRAGLLTCLVQVVLWSVKTVSLFSFLFCRHHTMCCFSILIEPLIFIWSSMAVFKNAGGGANQKSWQKQKKIINSNKDAAVFMHYLYNDHLLFVPHMHVGTWSTLWRQKENFTWAWIKMKLLDSGFWWCETNPDTPSSSLSETELKSESAAWYIPCYCFLPLMLLHNFTEAISTTSRRESERISVKKKLDTWMESLWDRRCEAASDQSQPPVIRIHGKGARSLQKLGF